MLFAAMQVADPTLLNLGFVQADRFAKVRGMLSGLSASRAQMHAAMEFSPVVAASFERQTEARIGEHPGITHVLQWGAMYTPGQQVPYSIITDGPYDPEDATYPVEWRPIQKSNEYFERQRGVYTGARYVFALSEWARAKLIRVHLLDPLRVIRIGWGPMFSVEEASLEASDPPYFVSVGNQWHRKGMDVVADAGHAVHQLHQQVKTVIAGEPQGLVLREQSGVSLMPRRLPLAEVKELLRGARALIVASRFDASPHVIMEALQMGTPVIGSDVCGIPEAVNAPLGGHVVPVGDADALTEAMLAVLADDVLRQRRDAAAVYASSGGWKRSAEVVLRTLGV